MNYLRQIGAALGGCASLMRCHAPARGLGGLPAADRGARARGPGDRGVRSRWPTKTSAAVCLPTIWKSSRERAADHDDINLERNQFGRESGEPLELPLGIAIFNHGVTALDVTEVAHALTEAV